MPFQPGHKKLGGSTKGAAEVSALAREYCPEAVYKLVETMRGNGFIINVRGLKVKVPVKVQLQLTAALALLERGLGKPVQPTTHSGPDGGPMQQQVEQVVIHVRHDLMDGSGPTNETITLEAHPQVDEKEKV